MLTKIVESRPATIEITQRIAREIAGPMRTNGLERKKQVVSLEVSLDRFGLETSLEENGELKTVLSRQCSLQTTANNHQKLVCQGLRRGIMGVTLCSNDLSLEKYKALRRHHVSPCHSWTKMKRQVRHTTAFEAATDALSLILLFCFRRR